MLVIALPILLVSALVTGHISRRRDRQDGRAGYALVIGYCVLASLVGLTVLSVVTFMSIR
jgi:hypothetical protein